MLSSTSVVASGTTGQTTTAVPTGGADVDVRDGRGLTPVMLAVLSGQLETAVQLALSGANLGCRDPEGRTALELAVLSSNREVRMARTLAGAPPRLPPRGD